MISPVASPCFANRPSRSDSMTYEDMLRQQLGTEEGRKAFQDHLRKEFSIENMIFWEEVQKFKKCENPASEATRIYEEFVISGADYQVGTVSIRVAANLCIKCIVIELVHFG